MLGESIVHAEDIRLPLGIRHDYPVGTLTGLAGSTTRAQTSRCSPSAGSAATASSPRTGPALAPGRSVSGTTLGLTMAMAGRTAYCGELQGDGAATLRDRCEIP